MNNGPVLIVEDDQDDDDFLKAAWEELPFSNELIFFANGKDVLAYLQSGKPTPFLILCDVNLPKMSGFDLKAKILEDESSNYKSIPFVFWSTVASKAQIQKAYDLGGNGFFLKGGTVAEIKQSLVEIVQYWLKSQVPE